MITNIEEIPLIPDHEVAQFIQILESRAYYFIEQQYSPMAFGNYLIVLCSSTICCRLIRDRSQWSISIKAVLSKEWFDLEYIRTLITGEQFVSNWPIDDQLRYIAGYLPDIETVFSRHSINQTEGWLMKERRRVSAEARANRDIGTD